MCGKILNHTKRKVLSDLFEAFFKKSLQRKICLLLKRNGCSIIKPA